MRVLILPLLAAFLSAAELDPEAARKLDDVHRVFKTIWDQYFSKLSNPPDAPKMVAFTKSSASGCGKLAAGNAYYCEQDNTIYYDSDFMEVLRKSIGSATNTDGDAAPVVAIAHEMGHAIYARSKEAGPKSKVPYYRLNGYGEEKMADCYAGALTRAAFDSAVLNASDLREAEQTMVLIGGALSTGSFQHNGDHPNWRVRRDTFVKGFQQGVMTCSLNRIENLSTP